LIVILAFQSCFQPVPAVGRDPLKADQGNLRLDD
jgi:hypothetical protein